MGAVSCGWEYGCHGPLHHSGVLVGRARRSGSSHAPCDRAAGGTALLAGLGGTLLFGPLALLTMAPLLWRKRRRTNGWRSPLVLVASVAVFAFSAFVISPADASEPPIGPRDSHVEHQHGG